MASGPMSQVPGPRSQVPSLKVASLEGEETVASDPRFLYQVPSTKYQVPSTR